MITRHRTRGAPIRDRGSLAFTLLELMAAIFILALVLTAIYATWSSIVKGTRIGLAAAAQVQRSRIAMRALEDAFLTVQMYAENMRHYLFIADTSGDFAAITFVSRLPASFPGVGRYGDQIMRRVSFFTQPGTNGAELVMTQVPMLLATNEGGVEPYSLVLARDVSLFMLEFWDQENQEWATEWMQTNQLPKLVKITLGQGKVGTSSDPADISVRMVAIPTTMVAGMQGITPGAPPPGGGLQPGQPGFPGQPGVPGQPNYPGQFPNQPGRFPNQPGRFNQPGQFPNQPGYPGGGFPGGGGGFRR